MFSTKLTAIWQIGSSRGLSAITLLVYSFRWQRSWSFSLSSVVYLGFGGCFFPKHRCPWQIHRKWHRARKKILVCNGGKERKKKEKKSQFNNTTPDQLNPTAFPCLSSPSRSPRVGLEQVPQALGACQAEGLNWSLGKKNPPISSVIVRIKYFINAILRGAKAEWIAKKKKNHIRPYCSPALPNASATRIQFLKGK